MRIGYLKPKPVLSELLLLCILLILLHILYRQYKCYIRVKDADKKFLIDLLKNDVVAKQLEYKKRPESISDSETPSGENIICMYVFVSVNLAYLQ